MTRTRLLPLLIAALAPLATGACAARTPGLAPSQPEVGRTAGSAALAPHAVVEARTETPLAFTDLGEHAARAEVVYFGELHNDPGTHQLQLALLEEVARRRGDVVLSLEMFERDVQPLLTDYLAGRGTEAEFLAASRPWPNYATDYRPLVEFAKAHGWPVLAANVPRPLAALVARGGLDTLNTLPQRERALVAAELECPRDHYYERFKATMGEHPGMDETMLTRFYEAQCIKDETMAEAIASALDAHPGTLIVHMNGSFHSDYGDGVPARVARRRPESRALILTGIPVAEPTGARPPAEKRARADYLIFTRAP